MGGTNKEDGSGREVGVGLGVGAEMGVDIGVGATVAIRPGGGLSKGLSTTVGDGLGVAADWVPQAKYSAASKLSRTRGMAPGGNAAILCILVNYTTYNREK